MSSWTFFGTVEPERIPMSWGQPISGRLEQADFGIEAEFFVAIHASQVIVNLTATKGSPEIYDLRNIALDCARSLLTSWASSRVVTSMLRSGPPCLGTRMNGTCLASRSRLAGRGNSHRKSSLDGDLALAISGSIRAQMVFRDFQLAMRDAVETGFYCYRAVEAMMQSMKSDATTKDNRACNSTAHRHNRSSFTSFPSTI
jgi:hypothetical protein